MTTHLTTDDLNITLLDLRKARTHLVYFLGRAEDPQRDPAFKELARVQAVVSAFEAVIDSGATDPKIDHDAWLEKWMAKKDKRPVTEMDIDDVPGG